MLSGFKDQQRRLAMCLLLFVFSLTVCQTYNPLKDLKQGDFGIVSVGKYHGTTIFLRDGAQYKSVIDEIRDEIEGNRYLLPKITRLHYDVPGSLVYKFKFAAHDSVMDNFILRYFARIYDHPILAGYQIQFVFNTHSRALLNIYTSEVGLE